jgi:hypothetical protein
MKLIIVKDREPEKQSPHKAFIACVAFAAGVGVGIAASSDRALVRTCITHYKELTEDYRDCVSSYRELAKDYEELTADSRDRCMPELPPGKRDNVFFQ